jgi:hypothetical protein
MKANVTGYMAGAKSFMRKMGSRLGELEVASYFQSPEETVAGVIATATNAAGVDSFEMDYDACNPPQVNCLVAPCPQIPIPSYCGAPEPVPLPPLTYDKPATLAVSADNMSSGPGLSGKAIAIGAALLAGGWYMWKRKRS